MDEKKIAYKRVLLKLSGEALSGDAGTGAGGAEAAAGGLPGGPVSQLCAFL